MLSILLFDDWHLARRVNMDRKDGSPDLVLEGWRGGHAGQSSWSG